MNGGGVRGNEAIRGTLRALAQPVTYLGVGLLAFIYCTLAYLLVVDRRQARDDARRQGANLVRIIDQSYSYVFKRIDSNLLYLRTSYEQNPSGFDLSALAGGPAVKNEMTFDFVIVDAKGRIVDSTYSKAVIGTDRSDTEAFRAHVDAAEDRLFISKPVILRFSKKPAIILSRRMTTSDGKFAGVVAALLDQNELARQISTVDLGRDDSVGLVGRDGVVRTRATQGHIDWNNIGRQVRSTAGILVRLQRANSGHYWNAPGAFDNVSRMMSFRALESFPLIAFVGISEAEVYRHAAERARIYWGIAILLSVAILIAIGIGAKRERKLIETTSEMQQAQEKLQLSQERYTQVERAVNDGIWDRNLLTGEGFYSPRWKIMLGYPEHGPPDGTSAWFELIHPDDRAAVAEAIRAHLEDGVPYKTDYRLLCKNGDYRWVQSRGKAIRDATGRSVRMVGTVTDITERKQAEALVEESRSNLERAERMALLGHHRIDKASNQLTWSEGVYRIFGKSSKSFTPTLKTALALVHPDDRRILVQYRRDAMEGLERPPVTLRAVKDDGQAIYVENWLVPVRGNDGAVTGVFGTVQDVTARKQAEEALERANQELETRVEERTAELAQEMRRLEEAQMTLAQMQKMEAVGQLTAGIAHDFNNLLAVIRGSLEFVEAAAGRGLTAEPDLIDAAMRAARRGTDLVQRLLAFSRQSPLRAQPTVINQLVLDTLRLLQRTLGADVEIVTHLDATPAMVSVDRNQLANALVNLALNARDAMPGGGRLAISTMCQPAPSAVAEGSDRSPNAEEVCIIISDTGTGMPDDVRARAFEPFFTTKPNGLGSGLGLSMVHGFVEQSGGHIEIDSAVGSGTTIVIKLPKIASVSQADEIAAASDLFATEYEKTVLLVEDDPDVRVVTAAQLKQLGYKVHAVANGDEAIDMIESPAKIDVTLTDIVLPGGIDGVTLVKEALRVRPRMGVVCMSGYDPVNKHRKWLEIQNIEFLEKPFTSRRLAQALDALQV